MVRPVQAYPFGKKKVLRQLVHFPFHCLVSLIATKSLVLSLPPISLACHLCLQRQCTRLTFIVVVIILVLFLPTTEILRLVALDATTSDNFGEFGVLVTLELNKLVLGDKIMRYV